MGETGKEKAYWKKRMSSGCSRNPGQKPSHWPEYQWWSSWQLSANGDSPDVPHMRLKDDFRPYWLQRMELLTQAPTKKPRLLRLNLCRTEAAEERSSEPAAKQGLTTSFHGDVVCAGGSE